MSDPVERDPTLSSARPADPPAMAQTDEAPDPASEAEKTLSVPVDFTLDIEDAQHLRHDLQDLLSGVETVHLKSDVKAQISRLNAWATRYAEGLEAARQLGEIGMAVLEDARVHLAAQLDDYLRLEGEGGQVATPDQGRLIDELNRALRRITRLQHALRLQFTQTQ
ncbi:hypothetical protein [Asticcacaulis excentricus]|uniref:CheA signal transduction histidine kinase n=1 Tax=Asticcacaulis excentricus (strain ATCC 15261 / DSM 4724 / KCTC 12464 / NCIMB 9791 / VKM B-1370 / CB 48) TaxID=573065 RepID=E8RL44_ASTEC|nr:hypothetical protein [Asticcacaulis excentricus]ADU13657.1 CheA signal transduction histidine kinase [Asticcacaulis excentricus CB 48]